MILLIITVLNFEKVAGYNQSNENIVEVEIKQVNCFIFDYIRLVPKQ